jgi:metal-responsive CopG/Arc/MetJ family transcriptional regulator
MSEPESPFKSLKITLSDEALARLDEIVRKASFRSYSSGVEECIRVVYDVMAETYSVIGELNAPITTPTIEEESRGFQRIVMRMSRFTGRQLIPTSK